MTRVNPADQLAALMRSQVASLAKVSSKRGAPTEAVARKRETQSPSEDLASVAAERIRGIDPADPDKQQKAVRAFLECVLLAQLGADVVQDAAFGRMVDHVQEQLQQDPELARAAAEASEILLNTAGR